ncbi:MAG: nuclear transport factor 2 family protein [Bacteroidota bacterium]
MRNIILLIIMISASSVYAQDAEVAKAVETLKQALLDGKREALEKIAHDNLTYGHSSGLIEDKKAFVEALASGKSDFVSITITEQVIKVTGNVATVRHKLAGETVNSGTQAPINLSVLTVWIKEKGEWKLLARQAVKITS